MKLIRLNPLTWMHVGNPRQQRALVYLTFKSTGNGKQFAVLGGSVVTFGNHDRIALVIQSFMWSFANQTVLNVLLEVNVLVQ